MTIIRAVGNQKGGVGKTTTLLGLTGAEAHADRQVLVIDMDPQGNASTALGVEGEGLNVYDALMAPEPGSLADVIRPSTWKNVDVAPAHKALALFERADVVMVEHRLSQALEGVDLSKYDTVYIDMPPQLGRLVYNALVVADEVLVVTVPSAWSVDGIVEFMKTVDVVKSSRMMNPSLRLAGVVINAYDQNRTEHQSRRLELEDLLPGQIMDVKPPRLEAAPNMAAFSAPIYEAKGSGWNRLVACYEILAATLNKETN